MSALPKRQQMQTVLKSSVTEFIHQLHWANVPPDVQQMAAQCVLDLAGTLVAGSATELSRIVRHVAAVVYGGDEATLLLDGRRASAPGAVLANSSSIDAMDVHDGHRRAKGHAGVNVLPAALAAGELMRWDGKQLMAAVVMGYEVALRAALALHATACDYHTSGAWGARRPTWRGRSSRSPRAGRSARYAMRRRRCKFS